MSTWKSPKPLMSFQPGTRRRAQVRQAVLSVYYRFRDEGAKAADAENWASAEHLRLTGKTISEEQIRRWARVINQRGGVNAELVAYCDERETPHVASRLSVPEELISALRSKCLEPGVGEWNAAVRCFALAWQAGATVPGLGRANGSDEAFPFTAKQLRKFAPTKAARVEASQGKFAAKAAGLLPALPISTRNLRLREVVSFDDKRLDLMALDDLTGRQVTLRAYFAMDEGTSQLLGYLLREDGAIRATDVEALSAFILRVAGYADPMRAGYATALKYERGTVAISPARQKLLEAMFPSLRIARTSMIREGTGAAFGESASGNFFGKGRLEAFMGTLDHYLRHLPGQRGNVYRNEPLMLGDLLLSPERLVHPNYRRKGSMIEEALALAISAQALPLAEGNGAAGALAACRESGARPALLFVSEVNCALQAAIAYYNAERGHRREGFATMSIPNRSGGWQAVTESANDKAARLEAEMEKAGQSLSRISAADTTVLLHKCRRVTVRPNGARVRINGVERVYWSEDSLAVFAAQKSSLGEKEVLALYNPEDPRELILLHNPPGRVARTAEELPAGEEPVFLEALPLNIAPDANDEYALAQRARRVAAVHGRVSIERARTVIPFLAAQTARREQNLALSEPLAKAVNVLRDSAPKAETPESDVGLAMSRFTEETQARERYLLTLQRQGAEEPFDER